jgi:chromosomal replication initiator protein
VGLGKTHLLHAIAWDVRRRHPSAQVLYLTAERFRYRFVEALKSRDALAFKETLRGIDILLIDDMEFLHGEKTEQEFDHTLNSLLDSGKQVVVASARAPSQLESLDPRMRSRLSGGLVTEICALDYELRLKVLAKRAEEKRAADPSFQLTEDVVQFLASKLTESGRELDGAVTRLYAACHLTGTPITIDTAEHIIRDLMRGMEPKRIKIDDILKLVTKHYGISRNDILSQRRHRSIVWPRQIGMYLSKKLTSRSLPEIGRRFGGRDHTTVLHAIRKIEKELTDNTQLKDELDDLKRLLNS